MNKKKKFDINLEIFIDIFQICPRVHGQNFDEPHTDDVIVSFFKEISQIRDIKSITNVVVDQMHQPWRTFATILNRKDKTISKRNKIVSPEKPTRKSKRVKIPAKKSTNAPTACAIIRDTSVMSVSKKKEKVTSLRDFHKTHPSGSGIVTSVAKIKLSVINEGTYTKPGVPDVTEEESTESEVESWGRDEDDSNNDRDSSSECNDQESGSGNNNTQSDNEKVSDSEHETNENESGFESDKEENQEDIEDDEEEKDDEFVKTPYNSTDDEDKTNVESKVVGKAEDDDDEGMGYTTNQFDNDVDVRLNTPINTDEGSIQKEGLIKYYDLDKSLFSTYDKVHSLKKSQKGKDKNEDLFARSNRGLKKRNISKDDEPKKGSKAKESKSGSSRVTKSKSKSSGKFVHAEEPEFEVVDFEMPKDQEENLGDDNEEPKGEKKAAQYDLLGIEDMVPNVWSHVKVAYDKHTIWGLIKYYDLDKSLFLTYDKVHSLKKSQKGKDKDEDLFARSNRGLKKRKISKDDEPKKGSKAKESKSGSSRVTKSQSKSSGKFVHVEEPEFKVVDFEMPKDQEENLGDDNEEPKREVVSKRNWFTKPKQHQEPTVLDWNVGKTPQQ
nr:hypothetical protein [Tanacetum cinerariifolium]